MIYIRVANKILVLEIYASSPTIAYKRKAYKQNAHFQRLFITVQYKQLYLFSAETFCTKITLIPALFHIELRYKSTYIKEMIK